MSPWATFPLWQAGSRACLTFVLVEALYDRAHAEQATLVNLLQRRGYEDLEAVLAKGHGEGLEEAAVAESAAGALR
jgi:hypothetical protein